MHEIYEQALNHERDPSIALNRHLDKAIRYGMDAPQAFTGFIEGILRYAEDALTVHEPSASSKLDHLEKAGGTNPPQQLQNRLAGNADHFGCVLALISSRCVAE